MKMSEILITFIVPIYNVEKYLDECINSILRIPCIHMQEIILVNDGSKDNSGKIADNYAVRYSNIKCFHKKNGGLSDARNFGLERAAGKYVCFIDSDDTVEPDSIIKPLEFLNNHTADILLWDADIIDINGNNIKSKENSFYIHSGADTTKIYTGQDIIMAQLNHHNEYATTVWLGIYRKKFLTDNEFWFEKNILHEDELWTPKVLSEAQSVKYFKNNVYHYRVRNNSIMRNERINCKKHLNSLVYIFSSLYNYFDRKDMNENFRRKIKANISKRFLHSISRYNAYKYPDISKKIDKKIIFRNSMGLKDIIRSTILITNGKLYCRLTRNY